MNLALPDWRADAREPAAAAALAARRGALPGGYSAYLDLVRVLAALVVLLSHYATPLFGLAETVFPGHDAVVLFFVLSGFVIAFVADTRETAPRAFAIARLARLWSVALPSIGLAALAALASGLRQGDAGGWVPSAIGFARAALANAFFLGDGWGPEIFVPFNPPMWSLNYEAWYYAIFGASLSLSGRRRAWVTALLCLAAGPRVLALFPCWLLGVALYRWRDRLVLSAGPARALFLSSLVVYAVAYALQLPQESRGWLAQWTGGRSWHLGPSTSLIGDFLLAPVFALNLVAAANWPALQRALWAMRRPVAWAASYTLSIYLFHTPLLAILYPGHGAGAGHRLAGAAVLLASILLILLLGRYTEHRRNAWRARIGGWLDALAAGLHRAWPGTRQVAAPALNGGVAQPPRLLRVLQLGSPTGMYGAERWILALARYLDPARVHTIVATLRDDPALAAPLCQHAAARGFATRVFEAHGRFNPQAIILLRRYILANGIDIVHTHGYKGDILGRLATLGTGCRIVATPHGWSRDAGLALQIYEWLDRLTFLSCDAVAPLSDELHDELRRIPGLRGRLHLIRNGVDIGEIEATSEPAADLRAWKRQGEVLIGYVGQLIPRKGLATLLAAFRLLDLPKKRLLLVGEGSQRRELEALAVALGIAEQVTFTGFREDRIALLKGLDAFVLPSQLEGIPRCLMEAMAAGVPVVASDIPGCTDLVTDGGTGLLFPVGNAPALADALVALLSRPALRAWVVTHARDQINAGYSASRMSREYEGLYARLVH